MLLVDRLGLTFRRHDGGQVTALEGVSLRLNRREVVGLVGGSGAGKSLVAEAICGVLPRNAAMAGQITVDGLRPRPGQIALAPQGVDALDPLARIGVQIARFARLGRREVDGARLLERLGLPEGVLRAWPHELSGGMAKRALIATALATGADWIITDEPTLGLDPETAERIMALLAGLAWEGKGVLVISHDLPRLVSHASRVTILREGRMVETAAAMAFAAGELEQPYARALWAAQTWEAAC